MFKKSLSTRAQELHFKLLLSIDKLADAATLTLGPSGITSISSLLTSPCVCTNFAFFCFILVSSFAISREKCCAG